MLTKSGKDSSGLHALNYFIIFVLALSKE
jgi:hypothetical protein